MIPSEAVLIGMPKEDIDTPALVIDLDILEDNIARMADYFRGVKSSLRPHFKTHQCPIISHKQLEAGAAGIACGKLEQAEALVNGGITRNILIANQVVTKPKIAKLMGLNRHAEVMCSVDNPGNITDLSDAAQLFGVEIGVLVEVNVGLNRCGVDTPERALELAKQIEQAKGLRFMGLQAYEGHLDCIGYTRERKAQAIHHDMQPVLGAVEIIKSAGLDVPLVDAGGTGSYDITGEIPGITEIQAGSYVFMDNYYLQVVASGFRPSLTLLTSVMSLPCRGRVIADAGFKSLTDIGAMPSPLGIDGAKVARLNEEHCFLEFTDPSRELRLGDKIDLVLGNASTTVNLHDRYYGVRNGKVEVIWPITGRGKFR